MKTIIKIAVLLLALVMIVPCLAACNKTGGGETTTKPNGPDVPGGEDPYLQVVDMKRYEYNAYVRGTATGNGSFYTEDFWIDPEQGGSDALSFAVIERNQLIESTYNCRINQIWSTMASGFTEMGTFFSTNQEFELAILMATDAASCATAGHLSNIMNDFNSQYINLDNEAFDLNSIEQMTLGDSLYFLSGDMNISSLDNTIATIFNTNEYWAVADDMVDTFEDDDFASPYTMVEEGKWTISNMLKIANEYTLDADESDGPLAYDKGDQIGYFIYQASPVYYYYGAGLRISENLDGYPQFTINTDEAAEVYDFLYENLNVELSGLPNGASADRAKNFQAGAVLFADYILWDVRRVLYHADIDFAYGILPVPTVEENEDHHSVVLFQNCASLWALPYKRANAVNSSRMMYIMTVYSGMEDSTQDAYYIRTMYMEVAKDDGSRASLEIIRYSLVYDIALMYNQNGLWGNFERMLNNIDAATNKEYATYTSEANMQKANDQMAETIDQFIKYGAD